MTRICLIGDSHLGAMRSGWGAARKRYPDIQLTFFGSGSHTMAGLVEHEGSLTTGNHELESNLARTSGGLKQIAGDYNAYLLCGLGLTSYMAIILAKTHRMETCPADDRVPISDECFRYWLTDRLRVSLAIQTLTKLRQITSAPIAAVVSPATATGSQDIALNRVHGTDEECRLADAFIFATDQLANEAGIKLFRQPADTLESPFYTGARYARAADLPPGVALNELAHLSHMNRHYGRKILDTVLAEFP